MKCHSWYCSPECQTRHYKVHKVDCVTSHMEDLIYPDGSKFCRPTPELVQRPRNTLITHKPTNPLVLASSPPHNDVGGMCEREQKLMKVLKCAEVVDHGIGRLDMKRNEQKSVIEELIANKDNTREMTTCLCQHMACLEMIWSAVRNEMENINKVEIKTDKKKEPNSTEQEIWIEEKLENIACLASKLNEEKLKLLEQLQYLQNSLIEDELEMNCQEHFTDNGELMETVLEKQKTNSDLQVCT